MKIGNNTFEFIDTVKVRHSRDIMALYTRHEKGDIDDMEMGLRSLEVLLVSINGITDKTGFYDWMLDNLEPHELSPLSEKVTEIMNEFVKKNQNSSTNMKQR